MIRALVILQLSMSDVIVVVTYAFKNSRFLKHKLVYCSLFRGRVQSYIHSTFLILVCTMQLVHFAVSLCVLATNNKHKFTKSS